MTTVTDIRGVEIREGDTVVYPLDGRLCLTTVTDVLSPLSLDPVRTTASGWIDSAEIAVLHREGAEDHYVTFKKYDFTIEHPLSERMAGTMADCDLIERFRDMDWMSPGRYRVVPGAEGKFTLEPC